MALRLTESWERFTHPSNYISSIERRNYATSLSAQFVSGAASIELLSVFLNNPNIEYGIMPFMGGATYLAIEAVKSHIQSVYSLRRNVMLKNLTEKESSY